MDRQPRAPRPAVGRWVIDTRHLGRRPGRMLPFHRDAPAPPGLGIDVVGVPEGSDVDLDLRVESVVEGVLVSGTLTAQIAGECARCLDPIDAELEVSLTELFAYPESATDTSTDDDEVGRVVDHLIDLEPAARDAVVLALPLAPLCREDCPGLCPDCGGKRAELASDHRHETMDPRWAALRERFGGIEKEKQ
jgi:uncharacterized protein